MHNMAVNLAQQKEETNDDKLQDELTKYIVVYTTGTKDVMLFA